MVIKSGESTRVAIQKIEIIGDLSPYEKQYPYSILGIFPSDMKRICGTERASRL